MSMCCDSVEEIEKHNLDEILWRRFGVETIIHNSLEDELEELHDDCVGR